MARNFKGGKKNNAKFKGKGKFKNNKFKKNKFKKHDKKKKKRSFYELTHRDQKREYVERMKKMKEKKKEPIPEEEEEEGNEVEEDNEDYDEVQLNPVELLLSTFDEGNEFGSNVAVESDDSDEESSNNNSEVEMEEEENKETEMMVDNSESDEEIESNDDINENDDNNDNLASKFQAAADESDTEDETKEGIADKVHDPKDQTAENVKEIKESDEEFEDEDQLEQGNIDEKDQEECENMNDPFHIHFKYELDDSLFESVSSENPKSQTFKLSWPCLQNLRVEIPTPEKKDDSTSSEVIIRDRKRFARHGQLPEIVNSVNWSELFVKSRIHENLRKANVNSIFPVKKEPINQLQKELFSIMNNYQDLFYPGRTLDNGMLIRFLYCLHSVNHIIKTRSCISYHSSKLRERRKRVIPEEFRDQGLVKPKVLIVVPFKESCVKIVNMITTILFGMNITDVKGKGIIKNKKKFIDDFCSAYLRMNRRKEKRKPRDFEKMFKGNIDDSFRIGMSITKKYLNLYTDFYSSDIIIASPLGLRTVIGAKGDKDREFDFLTSIEILILDQAEVFLMQNWDHILLLFDHLHLQPRSSHDADFSRLRPWVVNGWTKYYRQTLIFSSLIVPELNSLFNRRCMNYAGKVRVVNPIEDGSISQVRVHVSQIFQRFEADSVADAIEQRFKIFTEKVLPQFRDFAMRGVLIYIPSYFDFVRIRNYMKGEQYNFAQICEYTMPKNRRGARDRFFHNDVRLMLYTERYHFYRRSLIKGIRHIIFYQPPLFPHFYSEICNFMEESNQNRFLVSDDLLSVTVLYCKYDVLQLSAIVKTSRAARMLASEKEIHMFATQ